MEFWRFSRAGVDPSALLVGSYDGRLVVLSFLVAVIAAYAALEIIERVGDTGATRLFRRRAWLATGALSMGLGIWAMHFIGMLAFGLSVPVSYDLGTTALSVVPAILASGVTIHLLSGPMDQLRSWAGGTLMGLGIGAMHYTGMEAVRAPVTLRYDPGLFALSILVAVALATAAFGVEARLRPAEGDDRFGALVVGSVVLGGAVCGMHYTAMEASLFYAAPTASPGSSPVFSPFTLSVSILVVSTLILAVAAGGAWMDRRLWRARVRIERLEGLLPICAWCKKIRDADGSWEEIEVYVRKRSEADFSHGICTECASKLEGR